MAVCTLRYFRKDFVVGLVFEEKFVKPSIAVVASKVNTRKVEYSNGITASQRIFPGSNFTTFSTYFFSFLSDSYSLINI